MVIDTSIFIDFLRKKDKTKTVLYSISENSPLAISVITLYELLMGATDTTKKNDIKILTNDLIILDFDKEIAKRAANIYHKLRRENKMIEFRDIFIAATCLVYEMPILTLNKKHFKRIPGIEFYQV